MPSESQAVELLIKKIKYAPSREWVNSYFDLIKRLVDATGLKNNDPRLVMSLRHTTWHFPVTINFRYALAIRRARIDSRNKLFVGLIFCPYCRDVPELQDNDDINRCEQFGNLRGELSEPPYFLQFNNLNEVLYLLDTSEQVYQCWIDATLAEVNRAKSSVFKKFHQPIVYRVATDANFRAEILDMAYAKSKPSPGLLPEEIDEPDEFYKGAVRQITINAYERNAQARNKCIEHYGARCSVCDMTFEEEYGKMGKGFIHVHHLKPLGDIGADYKVDPVKDLRPICPNCHAMIHMRKPAYSIEEVKAMLKKVRHF